MACERKFGNCICTLTKYLMTTTDTCTNVAHMPTSRRMLTIFIYWVSGFCFSIWIFVKLYINKTYLSKKKGTW